jgi:hypothetical protein
MGVKKEVFSNITDESLKSFTSYLEGGDMTALKREVDALQFLIENPQYRFVPPKNVNDFIDNYLGVGGEMWDSVRKDLNAMYSGEYEEVIFEEGIGGGKTYKCSIIISYEVCKLLCLRNPQTTFGLAQGSKIAFMLMSLRAEQALKIIFGEIKARIDNSLWFKGQRAPDPGIKSELRFDNNVYLIAGNSSETFPAGYNIYGAIMDEAAWYGEFSGGRDLAEEVFNSLQRRIRSRFQRRGKIVIVSSPRYVDDFVEKKFREASSNPKIFAVRHSTFEQKPAGHYSGDVFWFEVNSCRCSPDKVEGWLELPLEHIEEFKRNPEKAKRDYLAMPSAVLEPYFKDLSAILNTVSLEMPNRWIDSESTPIPLTPAEQKRAKRYTYAAHVDLGKTKDACGIVLAHRERGLILLDCIVRLKATPGQEIKFERVRRILYSFLDAGFHLQVITYDGWQCLARGTKIPLLNGTEKNIEDIKAGDFVYSLNDKNEVVPGEVITGAKMTGRKIIHEVVLDNKKSVRCSGNHPFRLIDRHYQSADSLLPGQNLRAFIDNKIQCLTSRSLDFTDGVFDIEIRDHHNFAVSAGVFVHNSIDSQQILSDRGFECYIQSIGDQQYDTFKDVLYSKRIVFPKCFLREADFPESSAGHLIYELKRLEQSKGGKVDHPPKGAKDVADAAAGAVFALSSGRAEAKTVRAYVV